VTTTPLHAPPFRPTPRGGVARRNSSTKQHWPHFMDYCCRTLPRRLETGLLEPVAPGSVKAASRPSTRGVQGSGNAQYRGVGERGRSLSLPCSLLADASSRADSLQSSLAGSYPGSESGVLPLPRFPKTDAVYCSQLLVEFSLEGPIRRPVIIPANRHGQFTTAGETRCGCVDRGVTRSLPSLHHIPLLCTEYHHHPPGRSAVV